MDLNKRFKETEETEVLLHIQTHPFAFLSPSQTGAVGQEPEACHSYNTTPIDNKAVNVSLYYKSVTSILDHSTVGLSVLTGRKMMNIL